jgi:hypothetical protein
MDEVSHVERLGQRWALGRIENARHHVQAGKTRHGCSRPPTRTSTCSPRAPARPRPPPAAPPSTGRPCSPTGRPWPPTGRLAYRQRSARLRDAISTPDPALPELAAHLERTIVTGTYCRYRDDGTSTRTGDVVGGTVGADGAERRAPAPAEPRPAWTVEWACDHPGTCGVQ